MSKINLNEEYNNFMKEFIISPSNKSHKERIVFVANENHANALKKYL